MKPIVGILISTMFLLFGPYMFCLTAHGQENDDTQHKPWWDHPKVCIAYGSIGGKDEPIDAFELFHLAGVKALVGSSLSESEIERAAKEGINLIGLGYAWGIPHRIPSCRSAVNGKGQITTAACMFSEPFWDATIRKPVINAVRLSVKHPNVVGFFVDSEQYGIQPRLKVCFCDDCWSHFMAHKGMKENVPSTQREAWLEREDTPSLKEYMKWTEDRLAKQYRELADEIHAINPYFVLGNLPGNPDHWYNAGMARGVATEKAPFFVMLESTYACAPGYGTHPKRGGWEPGFARVKGEYDRMGIPYRVLGGIWLTVNSKEKADPRYTRDVFQLYDQAYRLGARPDSDGYWFGPVNQITSLSHFRANYPGNAMREYWLALRSVNRLMGIQVNGDERQALDFLRRMDD